MLPLRWERVGLLLSLSLWLLAQPAAAQTVTIGNADPRYDTDGNIVDAHDGCLMQFGGKYYLYGTAYGYTDGWCTPNLYRCYSSSDLVTWKLETDGLLLNKPPGGVYFRPYVIYNATTHKYVLWYDWFDYVRVNGLGGPYHGVATSDVPQGPFVIQNAKVTEVDAGPGDFGLLVDDDGTAYLIHTNYNGGPDNMRIRIEKLSADYLSSTLQNSGLFSPTFVEAPALFKRNGIYYAMFDSGCGFCPQGSGAQVWTASSPLGPYTYKGNIGSAYSAISAQQTHVAKLATPSGDVYFWMGDRWTSTPDGLKGHDFQFWSAPLQFDGSGNIAPLAWTDKWTLPIFGTDATPPALVSVTALNDTQVRVVFSEPVDPVSAQTASNYTLGGGTISAASLGTLTETVILTTSILSDGAYTLTVNNVKDGSVSSNTIAPNAQRTFTYARKPSIQTPPGSMVVSLGYTARFTVQAQGSAPLTYQWSKNGAPIPGATGASYTTPGVTAADLNAAFGVTVSNAYGSVVSAQAGLSLMWAGTGSNYAAFLSQSVPSTMTAGQSYPVSVVMLNWGTSTWTPASGFKLGSQYPQDSTTWGASRIALGAGDTVAPGQWKTFTFNVTAPATAGTYNFQWRMLQESVQWFGDFIPNVAVTVSGGPPTPPAITTQPANQTVTTGQTATFSVVAAGTAPLSYQWKKNESDLAAATGSSYTTPATTLADSGSVFSVRVSNSAGSVTSNGATLTVVSTSDLLAHWKLDDGAGLSAADASGHGNTGTLLNGPVWTSGRIGGALSFDGANDYVDCGTGAGLDFAAGGAFTYAGWVKTTESFGTILGQRNGAEEGAVIDLCVGFDGAVADAGKLMAFVRHNGGMTGYARVTGAAVNDGLWHAYALTRNGSGQIELFLDGVSQGTNTGAQSAGAITTNLRSLGSERMWVQVGFGTADQRYLNGAVDDVRIYNRALAGTEVAALAKAPKALKRDFDGDGKADLLFRHPSSGDVFLWLMR